MKAAANIGGHPIHPMIIPFPIALWVFALIADLMFLWRGNPAWTWVAYYCLGAGCIGAIAAAVFGLIDLLGVKSNEAFRTGLIHASLNVVALLIFGVDFYLRTGAGHQAVGTPNGLPLILSIIGVLGLVISGWLGGELVFRYGLGVQDRAEGSPASEDRSMS